MRVMIGSQDTLVIAEMDEVAYESYQAMSNRIFGMNAQIAQLGEKINDLSAEVRMYKDLHSKAVTTATENLLQYLEAQRKLDLLKAIINET